MKHLRRTLAKALVLALILPMILFNVHLDVNAAGPNYPQDFDKRINSENDPLSASWTNSTKVLNIYIKKGIDTTGTSDYKIIPHMWEKMIDDFPTTTRYSRDAWVSLKNSGYDMTITIDKSVKLPDAYSTYSSLNRQNYGLFQSFPGKIIFPEGFNVSNVTNMKNMFAWADKADPNVQNWIVKNVTNMQSMFSDAKLAEPNVSKWDVSSVSNMHSMFKGATSANPDVSKWDVSNVVDMTSMFEGATSANPDVSKWDVSNVAQMRRMFYGARLTNPDFSKWNTQKLSDMPEMFRDAKIIGTLNLAQFDFSNMKKSPSENKLDNFVRNTTFNKLIVKMPWRYSGVLNENYALISTELDNDFNIVPNKKERVTKANSECYIQADTPYLLTQAKKVGNKYYRIYPDNNFKYEYAFGEKLNLSGLALDEFEIATNDGYHEVDGLNRTSDIKNSTEYTTSLADGFELTDKDSGKPYYQTIVIKNKSGETLGNVDVYVRPRENTDSNNTGSSSGTDSNNTGSGSGTDSNNTGSGSGTNAGASNENSSNNGSAGNETNGTQNSGGASEQGTDNNSSNSANSSESVSDQTQTPAKGKDLKSINDFSSDYLAPLNNEQTEEVIKPFTDLDSHWGKKAVGFVVSKGIFNGLSENNFAPNKKVSRAMVVTALGRISKQSDKGEESVYSDVPKGRWYTSAVSWAAKSGVVKGVSKDSFAPDMGVSREQLATMIYRYIKFLGIDVSVKAEKDFPDKSSIASYAVDAVNAMKNANIIDGRTGGNFDPKASATRAELSVMIERLFKFIASKK